MTHPSSTIHRQRGAALVVGMVLLLALTVMAIAGMSTASLELMMAGNEQYRGRAFQAAEVGVEQAYRFSTFNAVTGFFESRAGAVPNMNPDTYAWTVTMPTGNGTSTPVIGNSVDKFWTFHFSISSTGTSARNSTATNTQEVSIIANQDTTLLPLGIQPTSPPPPTGCTADQLC
jgi:type IV pilus assembly protein PilX